MARHTGLGHLCVCAALLLLLNVLGGASLMAQQTTGTLRGTVADQTGSSIPNARIELRNNATGIVYSQTSGADGQFIINLLPPGAYSLEASATGFQTLNLTGVLVEVYRNTSVLVELQVGTAVQSIDVQAPQTIVETGSATLGTNIDSTQFDNLPTTTATRNALSYAEMAAPGLRLTDRGSQVVANSGSTFNSNGLRNGWNVFYLDGSDNTGPYRGTMLQAPNPEAIEQVQVSTANTAADVGKQPGAVVNMITKSGTNQFHGAAFYFFGATELNANTWTRNQTGTERAPAALKQGGGAFGGPIKRDKTFFFTSYQNYRDLVAQLQNSAIFPTAPMRGGDFSVFPSQLYDPDTRQPIPNNRIPAPLLDPVAARLTELIPTAPAYLERFVTAYSDTTRTQEILAKIDHTLVDSHRLQFSYFRTWGALTYPMTNSGSNNVPAWGPQTNAVNQNTLSVQHIWSARPNVLVETRGSFSHHDLDRDSNQTGRNLSDFGAIWPDAVAGATKYLPTLSISNGFSTAQGTLGGFNQHNQNVMSSVTWIRGNHNFKFGGEVARRALHANNQQDNTNFAFTGQFASTPPTGSATGTGTFGYAMADFLMGRVATFRTASPYDQQLYAWSYFFFAQDEWRVSRKLTLTPGLRYEIYSPTMEANGRLSNFIPGHRSSQYPDAPLGLSFPGDAGVQKGFYPQNRNFAPRLGVAFDPKGDGRTAIRAGFGMYYSSIAMQWAQNTAGLPWNSSANGGVARLTDPWGTSRAPVYPQAPTPFSTGIEGYVYPASFATFGYDPNLKTPYAMQWNVSAERAFTSAIKVQAAYVGNRGGNQLQFVEGNLPVWADNASLSNVQLRRPLQNYTNIFLIQSRARSWYDALQMTADIRTGALTARTTYVYGAARSVQDEEWGVPNFTANPMNIDGEKAETAPRHMFRQFAVYSLPLLRNSSTPVQLALGGWKLSGSLYLTSGPPINVILGQDWNFDGVPNDRPDQSGPIHYTSGSKDAKAASFFSRDSFALPGIRNTFGNLKRNSLWGPGQYWQPNLSLMKEFYFTEQAHLQLRIESYNFLNHNSLGLPNMTLNNPNFTRILSRSGNREMQFGLRFRF